MGEQEIQNEITRLEAENAAIALKVGAVGIAGSIAGVYLANKLGKKFLGKAGYFIAGGMIARLPLVFIYGDKLSNNLARIQQLQGQLTIIK